MICTENELHAHIRRQLKLLPHFQINYLKTTAKLHNEISAVSESEKEGAQMRL